MMNKKITEIAAECGLYIDPHNVDVTMREIEFLAEYIVNLCIKTCHKSNSLEAAADIKKLFNT